MARRSATTTARGERQRLSGGRLLLNVVAGGDAEEQHRYGDWLDHDQRYVRGDGREGWLNIQASVMRDDDGRPLYAVAQVRDVSDDRKREDQLRFLAEHDSLTGIFNRRRFEDELDRAAKELEAVTKSNVDAIDEALKRKEAELLEV